MSLHIKKATKEDIPFLVEMMLQSSRAQKKIGLFDYLFEPATAEQLQKYLEQFIQENTKLYCFYENFLLAKVEDTPVGCLCTYEPRKASQEELVNAIVSLGISKKALEEKLNKLQVCQFSIDKRTLMFDFLEEKEGYLDVGILKALMQKSLLNARLKGYRVAQTIIEIGSLESQLFYEALGFKKIESKECKEYQEVFGRKGQMLFGLEF